jgi:hypothetical protein
MTKEVAWVYALHRGEIGGVYLPSQLERTPQQCLASCHRPSVDEEPGADPAATPTTRGEGDRCAATAAEPTRGREGRSEAASAADGAAGKRNMNSSRQTNA